ncbi:hypothetical protein SLA2020_290920 [Shorea laevis]
MADDRIFVPLSLVSRLALAFDGAILGVVLACSAVRALLKHRSASSALSKIQSAPSISVGDLRSIISAEQSESSEEPLVVARGTVGVKQVVDGGSWRSLRPHVLVSQESGDKAVIIQSMQTCIYSEWKGLFGWSCDVRAMLGESLNKQGSTSLRMVPFILVEGDQWLNVNMVGSKHPLPLTTVYHHVHPISASRYTFLQALFGHEYPVGLLDEEKILPLGKEISAVGICSFNDGVPEIKSCKELPYFLSELTKDQMVLDLAVSTKTLLWSGVVLGLISIGVLGYAVVRNWNKWKQWRQQSQRQLPQPSYDAYDDDSEYLEETEVMDNELCVICLMRRRRSAFTPCGHLVCCPRCAQLVESASRAKCPVCCQKIRSSLRIYG